MTIRFSVTLDDYVNYNRYFYSKEKYGRKATLISRLVMAAMLFLFYFFLPFNKEDVPPVLMIIILSAVSLIMILMPIKYSYGKTILGFAFKQQKPLLENVTVTLRDDGMENVNVAGTTLYNYATMKKIVRDKTAFYIFLSEAIAVIIPLSAFNGDESAAAHFYDFTEKRIAAGKSN